MLDLLLLAAAQCAGAVRADRGQSRPEAARLSRAGAAAITCSRSACRTTSSSRTPTRVVKRVIPEGQDHVLAVLAAAARRAVPLCRRARRHQDRPRASPRRHRRDAVPEPVPCRPAEGHGAQAAFRRRPAHRDPSAGLHRRARHRALCARHALSADSVHACAARSRICSATPSRRCWRPGSASIPAACSRYSPPCSTWSPRTLADPRQFDFAGLSALAGQLAPAAGAAMGDAFMSEAEEQSIAIDA